MVYWWVLWVGKVVGGIDIVFKFRLFSLSEEVVEGGLIDEGCVVGINWLYVIDILNMLLGVVLMIMVWEWFYLFGWRKIFLVLLKWDGW